MTQALLVLVVDDMPDAADMLAAALELEGCVARTAHSGREALAMIETFKPHLMLLDVQMPDMDGNELSRRVRARYGDDIVLVAVSGGDLDDPRVASTFERVDHYFRKPIDMKALFRLLPKDAAPVPVPKDSPA